MKSVVITGTSKGIGLETALVFGRAGYKVFATKRNPGNANFWSAKIISNNEIRTPKFIHYLLFEIHY